MHIQAQECARVHGADGALAGLATTTERGGENAANVGETVRTRSAAFGDDRTYLAPGLTTDDSGATFNAGM